MYVYVLAGLLALRFVARLAGRALPYLFTAACGLLFLPMVLLGAAGLAVWRRRSAPPEVDATCPAAAGTPGGALRRWLRQRRSLVLLVLLGASQYAARRPRCSAPIRSCSTSSSTSP